MKTLSKQDMILVAQVVKARAAQERADQYNHGKSTFSKDEIEDLDRIGDELSREGHA